MRHGSITERERTKEKQKGERPFSLSFPSLNFWLFLFSTFVFVWLSLSLSLSLAGLSLAPSPSLCWRVALFYHCLCLSREQVRQSHEECAGLKNSRETRLRIRALFFVSLRAGMACPGDAGEDGVGGERVSKGQVVGGRILLAASSARFVHILLHHLSASVVTTCLCMTEGERQDNRFLYFTLTRTQRERKEKKREKERKIDTANKRKRGRKIGRKKSEREGKRKKKREKNKKKEVK